MSWPHLWAFIWEAKTLIRPKTNWCAFSSGQPLVHAADNRFKFCAEKKTCSEQTLQILREEKEHAAGNRFKFCVEKKHAAGNRLTNFSEQPLERNAWKQPRAAKTFFNHLFLNVSNGANLSSSQHFYQLFLSKCQTAWTAAACCFLQG